MHPGQRWLVFGLLAACAADAAVIYKWTDADGTIHYSDQPVPGALRMVTSSNTANGIGGRAPAGLGAVATKAQPTATGYRLLAIESPAQDQVFFADDSVPVRLGIEPGLKENQSVTWHLNGKKLDDQDSNAVAFTLPSLPRGTYAIAATVTDLDTGAAQSTGSVTFYVRQPSELSPQHRRP
jgi:hypothetical protein